MIYNYYGKKIFITGATGFIGSHLCEMAAKKGFNVVGFDRYNPNNDHGWLNKNNYKNLKLFLVISETMTLSINL